MAAENTDRSGNAGNDTAEAGLAAVAEVSRRAANAGEAVEVREEEAEGVARGEEENEAETVARAEEREDERVAAREAEERLEAIAGKAVEVGSEDCRLDDREAVAFAVAVVLRNGVALVGIVMHGLADDRFTVDLRETGLDVCAAVRGEDAAGIVSSDTRRWNWFTVPAVRTIARIEHVQLHRRRTMGSA